MHWQVSRFSGMRQNSRNESEIFRAEDISGKTEAQRGGWSACSHSSVRALTPFPVLFPPTSLGLGPWPCLFPRNAAACLSVSPHSYLLDFYENPKSWSPAFLRLEMNFKAWSNHPSVLQGRQLLPRVGLPPKWLLSFLVLVNQSYVCEQAIGA